MMLVQFGKSKVIHGIKKGLKSVFCGMCVDSDDKTFYGSIKDVTCKVCLKKIQRENISDNILGDIEVYTKPIITKYIKTLKGNFKLTYILNSLDKLMDDEEIEDVNGHLGDYFVSVGIAEYESEGSTIIRLKDRIKSEEIYDRLQDLYYTKN